MARYSLVAWQAMMAASCTINLVRVSRSPYREHFVEGEVVEHLDQLRVGDLQRRHVAGEQLVMIVLRRFTDRHSCRPWGT